MASGDYGYIAYGNVGSVNTSSAVGGRTYQILYAYGSGNWRYQNVTIRDWKSLQGQLLTVNSFFSSSGRANNLYVIAKEI